MEWYENDVKAVITERDSLPYKPKTIFYGSSSIRLWNTLYEDFKAYKPVNLGFGGSTLAACVWFFDRIISPALNPEKFILYAGDNDLGDGRHPEEVLLFFHDLLRKFRLRFPEIPFYFVSIKPSLSRMEIIDSISHTNALIENDIKSRTGNEHFINVFDKMTDSAGNPLPYLFSEDGLHMNAAGYKIWKEVLLKECFNA